MVENQVFQVAKKKIPNLVDLAVGVERLNFCLPWLKTDGEWMYYQLSFHSEQYLH